MAQLAKYRVGPSDFFLPGDLKADADSLDAQIALLDDSTTANLLIAGDWLDSWLAWMNGWKVFYASVGFFSVTNGARDELISFENQFLGWYQQAQSQGATPAGVVIQPSTGTGATIGKQTADEVAGFPLPSVSTLIIVAGLLVALTVVWKVGK